MESRSKESESDNETSAENFEPDVHFKPVVSLPLINPVTLEEDESTLLKLRARLYRYDNEESPPMWKERGTGDIKILHHKHKNTARIVMRREKTLKICANHFIIPSMELSKPSSKKRNWWIWTVPSDFADEVARSEIFAIKFSNEENANLWKQKFEEAQEIIQEKSGSSSNKENEEDSSSVQSSDENSAVESELKLESEKISISINQLSLDK